MEDDGNNKRCRDDSAEFPEAKRLREADLIFGILDDNGDDVGPGADLDTSVDALADVIKSLEDEITAPVAEELSGNPQLDLGYLLEASDDELGLPPAVGSSPSCSTEGVDVVVIDDEETETVGFDRIWGFEDDIPASPYEGLEFGIPTEFDDGVTFDGGLFDFSDVVCGPSDAEDSPWITESLTPV